MKNYTLIFSDEFNTTGREFTQGFDKRWTAIENRDKSNLGQHYFAPEAVQTDKGNLIITTTKPKKLYRGAKYLSGSVQSWNKFCFTSGYVEVRAILPGKWGIPGTWPALWIMGNLGRASFLESQKGTWPWSFDACAPWLKKTEHVEQLISACHNLTDKHDSDSYPEHFGLNPFQGRGATEIDIMEGQVKERGAPAEISTSLQISPGLPDALRPAVGSQPAKDMWYQNLTYGSFTRVNNYYFGDGGLDSISALTQLNPDAFLAYHLYRMDWAPGPDGYIRWWLDENFLFEIPAAALNSWALKVPPRQIPVEPSYLILSTAVSEKFSPPCEGQICDSIWPSNFTIDYVRVYQNPDDPYATIGCELKEYPTKEWIFKHPVAYGLPWYVSLHPIRDSVHFISFLFFLLGFILCCTGEGIAVTAAGLVTSSIMSTCLAYSLCSSISTDWVHLSLALLCGLVVGGMSVLSELSVSIGCSIILFLVYLQPTVPDWSLWCIYPTLVLMTVILALLPSRIPYLKKVAKQVAPCGIGAFFMVLGLSTTVVGHAVWDHSMLVLLSLSGYPSQSSASAPELNWSMIQIVHGLFWILSLTYIAWQQPSLMKKEKLSSSSKRPVSTDAGQTGRAFFSSRGPLPDNVANYFKGDTLPENLNMYMELLLPVGLQLQKQFGFQPSSVRNQVEHMTFMLGHRTCKDPIAAFHGEMMSNYRKWCAHITVPPLCAPIGQGPFSISEQIEDVVLFFLIWGEASNLRHTPEFLNFLFHQMKKESVEKMGTRTKPKDAGYFLDAVITPVYRVVKSSMRLSKDHIERCNYDDFNEFFWKSDCLQYNYKSKESTEDTTTTLTASGSFSRPQGMIQEMRSFSGHGENEVYTHSIASGYAEKRQKTHLEKRSWFAPFRAFRRIYQFHLWALHLSIVVAYASTENLDRETTTKLLASGSISPFIFGLLWDYVSLYMQNCSGVFEAKSLRRNILRVLFHLFATVLLTCYYSSAWNGESTWRSFIIASVVFHFYGVFNAFLQICPAVQRYISTTSWTPIVVLRKLLNPLQELFVGKDILDPLSASVGYMFYWITLLSWKIIFSYRFEVEPLMIPSLLLYRDHVDSGVHWILTCLLIAIEWLPFIVVYFVDTTIWNAVWMAFTGTLVGFSARIGEIRNFQRARQSFFAAVDMFNKKLISSTSVNGKAMRNLSGYGATTGSIHSEVLEKSNGGSTMGPGTPLLYSRRKHTVGEQRQERRNKWTSFSTAWNSVVSTMRSGDIISDREQGILAFHIIRDYRREIFLPVFQLAGCFERIATLCKEFAAPSSAETQLKSTFVIEEELVQSITSDPMLDEAVGELWELCSWLLTHLLGPCHVTDIHFLLAIMESWNSRRVMLKTLDLTLLQRTGEAFADVVQFLQKHQSTWKKQAKQAPVKKSPSDFAGTEFPTTAMPTPPPTSGLHKSASTTGLSALGNSIPRRSRGSGVAKIGKMQEATKKHETFNQHHITSAPMSQVREKVRTLLNCVKDMLHVVDMDGGEDSGLQLEVRGLIDRLTWTLTQERGFMWDDEYTGHQLTVLVFEDNAQAVLEQLNGLLTLRQIDAQPKSPDARRRILFFVNSLFMEMPDAPSLSEMHSWSVMTPFYGEDVLYSKSDLESKSDGLDVHTLLYLQTLYKQDWLNFLERVKPGKNLWKDPTVVCELRLWASCRGQTLARTVQGMMYGEAALRLLGKVEGYSEEAVEKLVCQKFTYIVACQIYGRQKKNQDPKANDIEFLLHRFPNLRVAYIDEVRVNYRKEHSYFSVLVKSKEQNEVEEVYRIRLPGNPILGEGKPENQNASIIFTRGEALQTIDMNQDGYLEEGLKMRNVLQEFDSGTVDRPYTIVGLPEHIFTGSVSSLANYMALQETSFVTLGQRTLANPLRIRLHYGHPDLFNKKFFMTRGGISKASKGINLSEDIFAGYNNCLRGGSVKFPEYAIVGKGRDVGMQQIYKFEAKLAQGAAEQSLSRDVYRLGERLDFFKLLSFYYNHVGFYLNMSFVCWTVFLLTYLNLIKSLLDIEKIGGRTASLMSTLQIMLGTVAFLTTAPLTATISVERGFKAAIREVAVVLGTGGPLFFLFHIGTKWFYYGQTILAGGAKYRPTGRGFVTKHAAFDDLFRFYASSHFYSGVEIASGLLIFACYTASSEYIGLTWSLWLVVISWLISPFWFNPMAFEWREAVGDIASWNRWMRGDGGHVQESWASWFEEENSYFSKLDFFAKLIVASKGAIYALVGISLLSVSDKYHSFLNLKIDLPILVLASTALFAALFWGVLFRKRNVESGMLRMSKFIYAVVFFSTLAFVFTSVANTVACLVAFYYIAGAVGTWLLLFMGSHSRLVQSIYFVHDFLIGGLFLGVILLFSALFVPGKIQTWLLYNNALSRGVVIEDILRSNKSKDDEDETLEKMHMKSIIVEQQKVIALLSGNVSGEENDNDDHDSAFESHKQAATRSLRSSSESNFSHLLVESKKLVKMVRKTSTDNKMNRLGQEGSRMQRSHSTSDKPPVAP